MRNLILGIIIGFVLAVSVYFVDQRIDSLKQEVDACYAERGIAK